MKIALLALGGLLVACSGGSGSSDAGGCRVASDCPQIACQCSGGVSVPSACLCAGGVASAGTCGPGGLCATASDCVTACDQAEGLGGGSTGGSGGGGGGLPCDSNADCQPIQCTCPDAGSTPLATFCLQGECTPATSCPRC